MKKTLLLICLLAAGIQAFSQTREERLTGHVYYFASDSQRGRAADSGSDSAPLVRQDAALFRLGYTF